MLSCDDIARFDTWEQARDMGDELTDQYGSEWLVVQHLYHYHIVSKGEDDD